MKPTAPRSEQSLLSPQSSVQIRSQFDLSATVTGICHVLFLLLPTVFCINCKSTSQSQEEPQGPSHSSKLKHDGKELSVSFSAPVFHWLLFSFQWPPLSALEQVSEGTTPLPCKWVPLFFWAATERILSLRVRRKCHLGRLPKSLCHYKKSLK